MRIITNGELRPLITWQELSTAERKDFDYLSSLELTMPRFVRYRGNVYDVFDTARISPPVAPHPQRPGWEKWDSFIGETYSSGILFKFADGLNLVVCGKFY